LGWGLWQLPDLALVRDRLARDALRDARWGKPVAALATGSFSVCGGGVLLLVRPDGALHVDRLYVAPGEAVLIRGPTGRTVLVGRGRLDGFRLPAQVGQRLAVWEHGLYAAVSLDDEAAARLGTTLE